MKLEELGLTTEKLQEMLLEKLSDDFWGGRVTDADTISHDLKQLVEKRIKEDVAKIAEEHVLPKVDEFIAKLTMTPTNRWGEPINGGKAMTFREYLVECAEKYINEQVDYQGKSKGEDSSSWGWKPNQTRICHMIHEHLQYNISAAVQKAMKDMNQKVAKGVTDTVNLQIAEVLSKLKPEVKV